MDRPIYARVCKTPAEAFIACQKLVDSCGNKDGHIQYPIEISSREWKPKRSEQANRYLFGVVYAIISQETGNNVNDLHEFYLGEFFGWEEYEVLGRKRVRPRERSSKQVKSRFSEFLESVISHAASLGIVIPPPNHDLPADFAQPQERG